MARRTPEDRASANTENVKRVRRRYKKTMNIKTKILPGERQFIKDMVLVLKLSRYSHTQIGGVIGISRGQVREILEEADVAERLGSLQENLPGAALELLQGYSIEAVQAILDVLRGSQDDKIILQAAAEILDRTGVAKVSKSEGVIHKTNENKTTFGTDSDLMEALRQLPPEKQEEAAQMIEDTEKFLAEAAEPKQEEE